MSKRRSSTTQINLPDEVAMLGTPSQRRSTPRIFTCRTAWLTFKSPRKHEHIALVKDISPQGILFYSDLLPAIGERLDFMVEYLRGSEPVRLHLKGVVVRVEKPVPGWTPGVGICFQLQSDGRSFKKAR